MFLMVLGDIGQCFLYFFFLQFSSIVITKSKMNESWSVFIVQYCHSHSQYL